MYNVQELWLMFGCGAIIGWGLFGTLQNLAMRLMVKLFLDYYGEKRTSEMLIQALDKLETPAQKKGLTR